MFQNIPCLELEVGGDQRTVLGYLQQSEVLTREISQVYSHREHTNLYGLHSLTGSRRGPSYPCQILLFT
jgi:hypothetical protein